MLGASEGGMSGTGEENHKLTESAPNTSVITSRHHSLTHQHGSGATTQASQVCSVNISRRGSTDFKSGPLCKSLGNNIARQGF